MQSILRGPSLSLFRSSSLSPRAFQQNISNEKLYPRHVPTTTVEKLKLALGSSILAFSNPKRADMVAMLGDTTGYFALKRIHTRMLADPIGRQILEEKPTINTKTINFNYLRSLPSGTFGKEYAKEFSPDERTPVKYVDDPELAYVLQRYREVHDFWHVLIGMPTTVPAVKWFEWIQTGLPICALSALVGPLGMTSEERKSLWALLPWAIRSSGKSEDLMSVYYEHHFPDSLDQFRESLRLEPLPSLGTPPPSVGTPVGPHPQEMKKEHTYS